MIIVSIGGGLGNQMFQYAYYTNLKTLNPDETIKLDMYNIFPQAHNGYEIERVFNLKAEECSVEEVNRLSDYYSLRGKNYRINRYLYGLRRKLGIHKESYHRQQDFTEYDESFLDVKKGKNYYFVGAFANVKFFSGIEDRIKKMYQFPSIVDMANLEIKKKIENNKSVSIHIRRGDYAQLGLSMPSLEYYKNAVSYMIDKEGNDIEFFVFTDDATYSREALGYIDKLTIVTNNTGSNSFIDMHLMSLCQNNIIANSTFSFWGAYLNSNQSKVVIAPNLPFSGCKNIFMDDGWIVF